MMNHPQEERFVEISKIYDIHKLQKEMEAPDEFCAVEEICRACQDGMSEKVWNYFEQRKIEPEK